MEIFVSPFFISFVLLFVLALFLHVQKHQVAAIGVLCFAALSLRLFAAHLDPFLHEWDEKYHALVARNMMDDPFKPVLRTSILEYDYRSWCCNYIWLHKQPLFLWQMALSMKLFGVSEFAARYPSALMGALMVVPVYRIAKLSTGNSITALVAAMFMCVSNYQLELISGYHGMDHNDVAFSFYVLATLWAYTEYLYDKSLRWVILIGVFAGCAVLNKWLTGLLVYTCWLINIMVFERANFKTEMKRLLMSVVVACIVFAPWQLYILYRFPIEAKHEFAYNARHLFEVVEGHGGSAWFYFERFALYFGIYSWPLLPLGFMFLLAVSKYRNRASVFVVTAFIIVLVFFSFIVRSKLQSYVFVVAPLGFIAIAAALVHSMNYLRINALLILLAAGTLCYFILDPNSIRQRHKADDPYRQAHIHNTAVY
ncbi:MAG: glycosyl transferase family 39, partial [Flavipsychrobacter sp.]|nr:glycosyl transferase family 39 [Flavipsychrobacter sp.]